MAAAVMALAILAAVGWRWGQVTWQLRAARHLLAAGQIESALEVLASAERLQPQRPEVLYLLGRASRRADSIEDARSYFDRAVRAGWPAAEIEDQRKLLLIQTGRFSEARSFVKKMLSQPSDDLLAEEFYEAKAKGHMSVYQMGDALVCLNFWLDWRPQALTARLMRADLRARGDDIEAAIRDYRKVLEVDPDHVPARRKLAQHLFHRNQVSESLSEFQRCLSIRPDDAEALNGAAQCHLSLGDVPAAKRVLKSLLNRELTAEQRGQVLVDLGKIALLEKDPHSAVEFLAKAAQVDPRNCEVYHSLGTAYLRVGDNERASESFEYGEQINKDYNRLAELTSKAMNQPGDPDLRCEAGVILMKYGLKDEGAAWVRTALTYDPLHREAHEVLARYYDEIGNRADANRHRALAQRTPLSAENAAAARK